MVAVVINGNERVFQSIIAEIIRSSPTSLGVGGSPSLETQVMSHHKDSRGVTSLNPREIANVRVDFRSYKRFARQNSADEINPCAIIRANAPLIPQSDREKIPDATMLICPTEE